MTLLEFLVNSEYSKLNRSFKNYIDELTLGPCIGNVPSTRLHVLNPNGPILIMAIPNVWSVSAPSLVVVADAATAITLKVRA